MTRLADLDEWYRDELPEAIAKRRPRHATHAELVKLTEWKMARGVWRAPNLVLVKGNDAELVKKTSADALASAPHPTAPIAALAKLGGVGPATASALAAAAEPSIYPFFDELVAAQVPGLGVGEMDAGLLREIRRGAARARSRAGRRLDAGDGGARAVGVGRRQGRRRGPGRRALGLRGCDGRRRRRRAPS